ncbi:MAG: FAD:protein FMN transferase, partial [Lentisphaerae bacterium]|nr:FAD:protein FMN transferase [Lentisphaerota bacterium]
GKHAYNIGVRNPFDNDALLETVGITNCAVATSGNYEQFVEVEGKRIHHIIDPRTGYPAEDVAGVTVITPRGIDSDVFSTAIFVEGEKLVHHLRCTRRRTSVLRVLLETDGRESIRRYGWIWD